MPPPQRPGRRRLTRADLPQEFTPESHAPSRPAPARPASAPERDPQPHRAGAVRRGLRQPGGRVRGRLRDADGWATARRAARTGPGHAQVLHQDPAAAGGTGPTCARGTAAAGRATDDAVNAPVDDRPDGAEDVSAESLTEEIEESSTILELLDRIATIEEQQLEHQKSQLLLDTRGFFFAFLVSVSVIVAGVAPLVEAEPHDRLLIVGWTALAIVLAGLVYAAVRASQRKK